MIAQIGIEEKAANLMQSDVQEYNNLVNEFTAANGGDRAKAMAQVADLYRNTIVEKEKAAFALAAEEEL